MTDLDTRVEQTFPASDATARWTWDPQPVPAGDPLCRICDIYDRTAPLLDRVDRRDNDLAIALLSRHLAAFEHVWYPVVERRLSGAAGATWRHRRQASRLWRRMRLLQRCLAGDAQVAALDCASLLRQVRRTTGLLASIERQLLTRVDAVLHGEERDDALKRWQHALTLAPTRPHPHLPHHGHVEPLTFTFASWTDRLLDTLDARPVPRHRATRSRGPDLWTAYLTGQVPTQRSAADDDADDGATVAA